MSATGDLAACDNFRHSYWSPGWVMTIALLYRTFGTSYEAIRVFLVVAALATALAVYCVTRRIAGVMAAVFAAAFFLFSTLVFRFTVYYQYEILIGFLSFLCCAIVFSTGGGEASGGDRLKRITKGDALRLFLAGVLLGAAALISPRVLVLILLFGIALYMQGKTIRFIKAFPVFLAGILLVGGSGLTNSKSYASISNGISAICYLRSRYSSVQPPGNSIV